MGNSGPIWLVGMMGAGKSSVGPLLAGHLGLRFSDSDAWVEKRAGCSVARIFEADGEAHFRRLEADVIEELSQVPGVVALGGGAVAQPDVAELVGRVGVMVYLRARPETLLERIGDPASRPLLHGLDESERVVRLETLLRERESGYAGAEIVIDTDGFSPDDVAVELARQLERLGQREES